MDSQSVEEHEETHAVDYVEYIDDDLSETDSDQKDSEVQTNPYVDELQPECVAMEVPPSPSPVGSLPPTGVVMVEVVRREARCTVHEIGGTEYDRHREGETTARRENRKRRAARSRTW